jgi:hypothetical protein
VNESNLFCGNTWACAVVQQSASIQNGCGGGVLRFGLLVHTLLGISDLWFIKFYVHVTVHRIKFLCHKTNRRTNFPNLFWLKDEPLHV